MSRREHLARIKAYCDELLRLNPRSDLASACRSTAYAIEFIEAYGYDKIESEPMSEPSQQILLLSALIEASWQWKGFEDET
jgi:hypothetical protein